MQYSFFKPTKLLFVIFCIMLLGCGNNETNKNNSTISINLDKQLKKKIPFSQIFEEVQIIPLETNKESMIQKIKKFEIFSNRIYILDKKQKALLIFDAKGKFLKKIQSIGKGPQEYLNITDFNVNKNQIELLTPRGNIVTFDLNGNFINKLNLKLGKKAVHYFTNISDDLVCFYSLFSKNKITVYSKSQNKVLYETLEKPTQFDGTILSPGSTPFFNNGENNLYFDELDRQVFVPIKKGFIKSSNIDFGKYNLDYSQLQLEGSALEKHKQITKLFSKFVISFLYYKENKDFMVASFGFKEEYTHLILNKSTMGETVFQFFEDKIRFPFNPVNLYHDTLVTTIEPSMLFHYIPDNDSTVKCNKNLEDFKINDNPVLVKYKLKK